MERQAVTKVQKSAPRVSHVQRQTPPLTSKAHPLVGLQNSLGNSAIQRLISSAYVQTKLRVSTPGDPFEKEADEVADKVMRMPDPAVIEEKEMEPPPVPTESQRELQREADTAAENGEEVPNPTPVTTDFRPEVQRELEVDNKFTEEATNATPEIQRVPLAVREDEDDDEEKKVAPSFEGEASSSEDEKEIVTAKPVSDVPLLRQIKQDEDQVDGASLVQPQAEETAAREKISSTTQSTLAQAAPVTVTADEEEEEKVARELEQESPPPELNDEKLVATKPSADAPIQRQAKSDEDKVEDEVDTNPIRRQLEDEEESEEIIKPKSSSGSRRSFVHTNRAQSSSDVDQRFHAEMPKTRNTEHNVDDENEEQFCGSSTIATNIHSLNGAGSPLSKTTRAFFEPRFKTDFSQVRIHTDSRAAASAKALQARAFTVGQNIAFSSGEYAPESQTGRHLLAHELTHVVQQNGARPTSTAANSKARNTVMRQPAGAGGGGAPTLREPVELKGKPAFSPPQETADEIKGHLGSPLWVAVKFGSLATGELPVIWNGTWYDSADPPPNYDGHKMPIHNEGFPIVSGARPMLAINIEKSIVTGFVGWETPVALARDPAQFFSQHPLSELFGLEGLATDPPDYATARNRLSGGKVDYFQPLTFETGVFDGRADVSLNDEKYAFKGDIEVNEVKGIDKPLPLKKEGAKLFADKTWKFERSMGVAGGRLSGEIIGTFAGGKPDVRGTLKYNRAKPNVSGSVTVIVTTFDIAKEKVRDQLGSDAPSKIAPADPDDRLAIAGWGHVDFSFNEWLTGNADVIVHPEGYVTAKGEIVPTVVIPIIKKYEAEDKPLFTGEISKAIPSLDALVADVAVTGSLDIKGYASFGPGTMHDLRVAGLFSTDPDIVNTFELSGIVSVPAIAGIKAEAKAGLAARVWLGKNWEVSSVKLTIKGDLALQLYAEAAAAAGRRKGDDDQPEYFLKGKLEGGAGLKLDIHAGVSARLAFWEKHIDFYNRTFTIAGGSMTIDFDYVFGKKTKKGEDALKLNANLGSFDANKFAEAVVRGQTVEDKKYKGKDTAEGKIDTVPNPDAPIPIAPPEPTSPGSTGTPTGIAKTFDKAFTMEGVGHTLKLTLSDPPDLTMQTVLEPLLKKVERARKDVKKDTGLSDAEKSSRLAALAKIEASAKGVQAAAERAAKNPAFITPQIAGFDELATLISDYGDAYDVTDLGLALDKVVVDPSKPETVLQKFPSLASDTLVQAQVSRIIAAGVEATDLRKIIENVRPVKEDPVLDLIGLLEKMINSGATNWDKIITDLRIGGNKFKGASFVIRYIDSTLGWSDVGFEVTNDPVDNSGRRWDAWVSGILYQFKSWYTWPDIADRTFLRQILEDYRRTRVGQEMGLYWVFETSLTTSAIVGRMQNALNGVIEDIKAGKEPKIDGYTEDIALFISSRVSLIVKTVKP